MTATHPSWCAITTPHHHVNEGRRFREDSERLVRIGNHFVRRPPQATPVPETWGEAIRRNWSWPHLADCHWSQLEVRWIGGSGMRREFWSEATWIVLTLFVFVVALSLILPEAGR